MFHSSNIEYFNSALCSTPSPTPNVVAMMIELCPPPSVLLSDQLQSRYPTLSFPPHAAALWSTPVPAPNVVAMLVQRCPLHLLWCSLIHSSSGTQRCGDVGPTLSSLQSRQRC